MQKIASFDIEIADVFDCPPGTDIDQFAPFHISVAAVSYARGGHNLYYSRASGGIMPHLSQSGAWRLLDHLKALQNQGYMVCAWNGLSFDLKWIGYASGDMKFAAEVAMQIYDPMFQFFCVRGFPVGLAAAARGLGIEQGKLMDGADAPKRWAAGEHKAVMDYVVGDCQLTNAVIAGILEAKAVRWFTQRGKLSQEPMPRLITVAECLCLPEPDCSWMDAPIPRSKFCRWLDAPESVVVERAGDSTDA